MAAFHEQDRVPRVQLVAPRVLVARLLQVALRTVHVSQERVRSRLLRCEILRRLHVLECLREVARLAEHVRQTEGGVCDEHPGRERQRLRDRRTSFLVAVQRSLDAGEREPGTRAAGILLDERLPQRELPGQVLVEPFAGHLDLEPFRIRRARGMLLREREIGLELRERVRRVGDIQVAEGEVRIRRDGFFEMRVRVDEPRQIELPLTAEKMVPGDARGCRDRMLDHRARDGIERGAAVLRRGAAVPAPGREYRRQGRTHARVPETLHGRLRCRSARMNADGGRPGVGSVSSGRRTCAAVEGVTRGLAEP